MDEEIEIRKVPVQTRTSIPAIAVTAIVMRLRMSPSSIECDIAALRYR